MLSDLYLERKIKYIVCILLIGLVFLSFEYFETGMTVPVPVPLQETKNVIDHPDQEAEIRLLRLIDEVEERQEQLCRSKGVDMQWQINKISQ